MVKQSPVGAHYGLRDWLAQRITAIAMVLFTVFFAVLLLVSAPHGYTEWKALFSGWLVRPLVALFLAVLFYHAWIGMRDIWMDYVKSAALRLALMCGTIGLLAFYLAWSVNILWG